jgi:hypothetical protein
MASKQKLLTTAAFIAANVGQMSAINAKSEGEVSSVLLAGISELGHRVIAKTEKVDVGASYALAIVNDAKQRAGQPLVAKVEDLNKTARFGYTKLMRIADEHGAWFDKFITNCETMNASIPVTDTTLLHFGRVIFDKKEPVKACPSVATLKEWRADMLKEKKKGTRKSPTAKTETPADRIGAALDCFSGYSEWLPAPAHEHVVRCLTEMSAIITMLPKASEKPRTEEAKVDAIAELKKALAGK